MLAPFPPTLIQAVSTSPKSSSVPKVTGIQSDLLSIQGVGLSIKKSVVLRVFGTPARVDSHRDTEMGMGMVESLFYPGLRVDLCLPEKGMTTTEPAEPHVWRMTVTSPSWKPKAGIRVGADRGEVVAKLGSPVGEERRAGGSVLHYSIQGLDGWAWIEMKDGMVVEWGITEDWS